MKKILCFTIAAMGMFSFAFSQADVTVSPSTSTGECYYYSHKEGASEVKITVNMQIRQSIAIASIFREIYVDGKDKTSMTQKVSIEGTVNNGKIHYSSQKAIAQAADGSLEQSTSNELLEQEITIVDKNTLLVDGKTLTKGTCK